VLAAFVRACLSFKTERHTHEGAAAVVDRWLTEREQVAGTESTDRGGPPCGVTGNLVGEWTSFVGREEDVAGLTELLGTARLVTLTGTGGVGKSRLARRVAAGLGERFPDGVWMVELSPLTEPAAVVWTVASVLGIQGEGEDTEEQLARALTGQRTLLILDNCEHLAAECARLSRVLLGRAPHLTVLTTSRRFLGVEGEHRWSVQPFTVPEDLAEQGLEQALGHPALLLLHERLRTGNQGRGLTAQNLAEATRLCADLDGIPLAIELAARRSHTFPFAHIRRELARHQGLLADGDTTAHPRHQSLEALLDWSYTLCGPRERLLWSRASVFAGPFTTRDLAVVEYGDLDQAWVLRTLPALVDQSIVSLVPGREGTYRLLDTVRAHGRARLSRSEADKLREQHREWFASKVHNVYAELYSGRQTELLRSLDACYDDVRAALENLCGPGADPGDAQVTAANLWLFWMCRGRLEEGLRWLARALERDTRPTYARCRALWASGYLALLQGNPAPARARAEEALVIAERVGDTESRLSCRTLILLSLLFEGRLRRCVETGRRLLADSELERPALIRQFVVSATGVALTLSGDTTAGIPLMHRAEAIARDHGEVWHRSYNLWLLGVFLSRLDDPGAGAHLREALRLKQYAGDRLGLPAVVETVAWHVFAYGDPKRAARILGASEAVRDVGTPPMFRFVAMAEMGTNFRARLRDELGEETFERCYRQGHGLPWDEVIDLCLGTEP
jgi:non-specific serine/threonine protein kinase